MRDQVYVLITRSKLEELALNFINKENPSLEEVGKVLAQTIQLAEELPWEDHIYMGLLDLNAQVEEPVKVSLPKSLFKGIP